MTKFGRMWMSDPPLGVQGVSQADVEGDQVKCLCRSESEGSKERLLKDGETVEITNTSVLTERRYKQLAEVFGLK